MILSLLTQAALAEESDDLAAASALYASALDAGEAGDASSAIHAALTFFWAKDGGSPPIELDAYWYFDRWIAQAATWGAGLTAMYWKAYDAMIYGDGSPITDLARDWYAEGCEDALLTLAVHYPEEFAEQATAFAERLRARRTYRERYLYSILGHRFDKAI